MRLDGRSVLITGAGSGLGLCLVSRFLTEGARVAVLEKSSAKVLQLREQFGASVEVVQGDATRMADNNVAVERAVAAYGSLDSVVGNAGLWDFGVPLEGLPADERLASAFQEVVSVNVLAHILLARAAVRELRRSRGSITLTASAASLNPGGGGPIYTSSKHAVVGLVRQLAYELAPDVRVNAVAPGGMRTDLRGPEALGMEGRRIHDHPLERTFAALSPLGFLPVPEDYADWYVALASATEARTMTGAVLEADCGERVRGRTDSALARSAAGLSQDDVH